MASQSPSTPVKVTPAAASYTSATLDPDLRSQVNALLIRDGHVTVIQDKLLHAMHSNNANWPTTLQTHALNLLRSGEVSTFPALVRRVMDDIRNDTAAKTATTNGDANGSSSKKGDNADDVGGGATGQIRRRNGAANANDPPSLALPAAVLEEGLRATREALEAVCEIDDSQTS